VGDCYELLNSEVPGEVQNARWNEIIHSRNNSMNKLDPQRPRSASEERTLEFYNDPR
jgi:hypothetical protein